MASVPGPDAATRLLLRPRQLRDLVHGISWLRSLTDEEIDELLTGSEVCQLNAREWVFHHEAPAHWVYIVISGTVRLTRSAGDRLATIRCVERGGPLGQLSMVASDGVYLYSAEALRKTRLLAIPAADCRGIVDSHPACRADFMGGLALELAERLEDLALLTQADAMARLVSYLRRQLPPGRRKSPRVVRLAIPKRWLAAQLAMTPETLSRLLGRLRDRGPSPSTTNAWRSSTSRCSRMSCRPMSRPPLFHSDADAPSIAGTIASPEESQAIDRAGHYP